MKLLAFIFEHPSLKRYVCTSEISKKLALSNIFNPSSIFLLTISMQNLYGNPFLLFVFHVCHVILSVSCRFVITCWEQDDLLTLLCVVFSCIFVTFHMVSWIRCGI